MKHSGHRLGIYSREKLSITRTLLTDKKICSKHLFGTRFENFLRKENKLGGSNKTGDDWRNFQKLISRGAAIRDLRVVK